MASEGSETTPELESFRRQWLSDLQSKREPPGEANRPAESSISSTSNAPPRQRRNTGPPSPTFVKRPLLTVIEDDEEDYIQGRPFDEPPQPSGHTLADLPGKVKAEKQLVSALDHYEEAMEKEAQGSMGDSLRLYRRAYRLDNKVDKRYREKHFPTGFTAAKPVSSTPTPAIGAGTSATITSTSSSSTQNEAPPKPQEDPQPQTIEDLISSFSTLAIEPAPPPIENTPPPPCPIANIPDELLVHILTDVAVRDVGDFARLALVCKHFAYLVATEQRIWKRICLGTEFGFTNMHRRWNTGVEWNALEPQELLEEVEEDEEVEVEHGLLMSIQDLQVRRHNEAISMTHSLLNPAMYPSWKHMFRNRPRIRFNGCYISTVNYIRSGQASTNQATWGGSPIHIVTYYRYLRFFRDGSAISLLTTASPADVVHHLTPDLLNLHRDAHHAHLPSAVMNQALRGRWRLSSEADQSDVTDTDPKEQEADVYIETEGVIPKYMYRMDLSLRSAGKGSRNNKILWRGFYSYNKLTDDLAEFQLKNDKPFFFSRVKSYGVGEEA